MVNNLRIFVDSDGNISAKLNTISIYGSVLNTEEVADDRDVYDFCKDILVCLQGEVDGNGFAGKDFAITLYGFEVKQSIQYSLIDCVEGSFLAAKIAKSFYWQRYDIKELLWQQ